MMKAFSDALAVFGDRIYMFLLVPALLAAGVYFTIKTGFLQFRLLGETFRVVKERPQSEGEISSLGALMVSTASRVGTGNVMGVAGAILTGGFGSVFWMWVIALLGGATAFIESTLAQIYKRRGGEGYYGGPAYYIQRAMGGGKILAGIFCLCLIATYAVGFNMLTVFNLQSSFEIYGFYKPGVTCWVIGGAVTLLYLVCLLGGGRRIVSVTGFLVPLMSIMYVVIALLVTAMHIDRIPAMLAEIMRSAFDMKSILGGFAGSCVMLGVRRGLFSNEAGVGSAPNAAAAAEVTHPVKQGLVQMLSVFIDTLLLCSATALILMLTDIPTEGIASNSIYIQNTMLANFGSIGPVFLTFSLFLFAFTTLLGNYFYIDGCIAFLLGKMPSKRAMLIFRLAGSAVIFVGAGISMDLAWNLADILMGIMCAINIPVLFVMSRPALDALKDYTRQLKQGREPVFRARDIGLDDTELWR